MFLTRTLTVIFRKILQLNILIIFVKAEPWTEQETNSKLNGFLEGVQEETKYKTLVVFGGRKALASCLELIDLRTITTPVLLLDSETLTTLADIDYNRNLLIVYCVERHFEAFNFQRLLDFLGTSRSTKVVFYWQRNFTNESIEQDLLPLFASCQRAFMMNVLNVFKDVSATEQYFGYTQFEKLRIIRRYLNKDIYFPHPLANMHRAPIRTLPDSNEPRTIIYYNEVGKVTVAGYIAKLVFEFAAKHNATLRFPKPVRPDIVYFYGDLINMSLANDLDIPMSVDSPAGFYTLEGCSSIIEQGWWRPMLPVRGNRGVHEVYMELWYSPLNKMLLVLWLTFSGLISLHIFWENRKSVKNGRLLRICMYTAFSATLRSVLGQSTVLPIAPVSFSLKILYFFLFICGMFASTSYISYLQSFLTNPVSSPQIETIDELLASEVRVRVSPTEYEFMSSYMSADFFHKYKGIFSKTPSLEAFYEERKSLNTRHAYVVTSSVWSVFHELQNYWPRPLFRVTSNIYFSKRFYLCLPLQPYSIYRDTMNVFISQALSSGLFSHWINRVFDDMVTAGKIQRFSISHPELQLERALTLSDFFWIWALLGVGLSVSSLLLLIELVAMKICKNRRKAKLKTKRTKRKTKIVSFV